MRLTIALLCLASLVAAAPKGNAVTLYVSPQGSDRWSGRLPRPNAGRSDGPAASLAGARDIIRRLRETGEAAPVNVEVEDGVYFLTAPFVLSPQDSASASAPIVYEAAPGAHPVISGGRVISGLRNDRSGVWSVKLTDPAGAGGQIRQLWIGDRRARRSRLPATGFFAVDAAEQDAAQAAPADRSAPLPTSISTAPANLAPLSVLTPQQIHAITMVAFHKWDNTIHNLSGIDEAAGQLRLFARGMLNWNKLGPGTTFYLENVPIALGRAGDWSLSPDGVLSYRPLPGENPAAERFIGTGCDKLIAIQGDPAGGTVSNITFRGLSFEHGGPDVPEQGFDPVQAAATVDAAITVDGAQDIVFERCDLGHTGGYGIWFRKGCRNCAVKQCSLHDLGAGGVRIGETQIERDEALRTGACAVDNCIIAHGGRQYPCATAVWIGQSGDNAITHNEIADFFYTGISAGWTWGYGPSLAVRNRIAYNDIHHLGWRVLSDMGAVYTLGVSTGTSIDHNVAHDVYAADYGGWGLYTDEGSSGIVLEDNLVYDNGSAGFHQHYGRDNIVRNNIFALDHEGEVRRSRFEDHVAFTMLRNIIVSRDSRFYTQIARRDENIALEDNIYFSVSPAPLSFDGKPFDAWQKSGMDKGSAAADPGFANLARLDFRLKKSSPALAAGFVPFDSGQAGVYGPRAWRRLAASLAMPPVDDSGAGPVRMP